MKPGPKQTAILYCLDRATYRAATDVARRVGRVFRPGGKPMEASLVALLLNRLVTGGMASKEKRLNIDRTMTTVYAISDAGIDHIARGAA